jgi:hypothetical protein
VELLEAIQAAVNNSPEDGREQLSGGLSRNTEQFGKE